MDTKKLCAIFINCATAFLISVTFPACSGEAAANKWKAPPEADRIESPLHNDAVTEQKGQGLYNLYCRACHGDKGNGDGPAGRDLAARPSDFHQDVIKNESNGALFWKLTNGNQSMPSFKAVLTDEQRWQLVSFIRKLPFLKTNMILPVALRDDIQVEHYLQAESQAVRILHHPSAGDLWYTTFDGNVFRVRQGDSATRTSEKIFTVQDHGIEILQGAAFLGDTLFLCGNSYFDDKRTTMGKMVRFVLQRSLPDTGRHAMNVVFNTVRYAANKTIYDHGWNALVISPDKKYIFVNSGARTDHGEVQDNGGAYPNARDNALTSKVFRIPVGTTNLELPDDEAKLKAAGYLFASGIRNAYDLAFDPTGELFGVVNSADYDYPEDMFWIRENHHYGFPWLMGGMENPQQYHDWKPDPETDPFMNKSSHSWKVKYYHTDPGFPKRPAGVRFSSGVQNLGPDANEYRGHSGKIQDGDLTGVTVSTFTAHCSPLGLFFDTKKILGGDLQGDGFTIRFTWGETSGLMRPFTNEGADLLHLHLQYDSITDNYFVKTKRVVAGFKDPVDAVLVDNVVYVIEYGGDGGNIWKITLPPEKIKN